MVDPNMNFPSARKGSEPPKGGFGFGGPSEAWLKAKGLQQTYNGHSGTIDSTLLSQDELNQRRQKALERFSNPETLENEQKPLPVSIPAKPILSESELREKQRIAEIREQNLKKNQMELDSMVILEQNEPEVKLVDEDKRKKCLSLGNLKYEQVKVIPKIENSNFMNVLNRGGEDFEIVARDGVRVMAHRVILSARSSFFRVMLTGDNTESRTGEIYLPEFSEEVIRSIIEFLYSGQLKTSNNSILELIYLADFLKLEHLKILIQLKLCEFVSVDNIIDLYTLSEDMNLHLLRNKCEELMKSEKDVRKLLPDMPSSMKIIYTQIIKKK